MAPGEIVGFLGPNGAGKSTTVKIITGLLRPNEGRVLFEGRDIASDMPAFRASFGYVPEEAHLYNYMSGLEYLQLVGRLRGLGEALIEAKATRLLKLLNLESWQYSPISTYSKGMRQRVLIAAALLHDPKLLIFDEPLSGLDVVSARSSKTCSNCSPRKGKAILYISHVLEVVEQVCNRVIVIAKGRILADAPPSRADQADASAQSGKRLCATGRSSRTRAPLREQMVEVMQLTHAEYFQRLFMMSDPSRSRSTRRRRSAPVREPQRSQFSLLVRHFLERFFNHETASPDGDAKTRLVQIACATGLPGFVVCHLSLAALSSHSSAGRRQSSRRPPSYWPQVNHHLFFIALFLCRHGHRHGL